MAVSQIPPEPGTYTHVMRRYDRAPHISWPLQSYNLVQQSLNIEMFGVRAPTLFIPRKGDHEPENVARFAKLHRNGGWKDETARWGAFLEGKTDPAAPAPVVPAPVAPSESEHPALTPGQIASFGWQTLQKEAAKRGVKVHGEKRPAIEKALRDLSKPLAA